MTGLELRAAAACRFDALGLGEVMLRLDPGDRRIRTARHFDVWEGGGEYNVVRGLHKVFGHRSGIVTALADNEVGRLVADLISQGGVDTSLLRWVEYDGVGRQARNGLNFTERGFGVRGALGVSDRGHTAVGQLARGDVDWDHVFGELGARWLHTGGIFAALSASTPDVAEEAMSAARRHGTLVSYDLNFRPSLWQGIGGRTTAQQVNRRLAPLVDVMIGNEEDFVESLGFEVRGLDADFTNLDHGAFLAMIEDVVAAFPNLQVIATTLRGVASASRNDWSAIAWSKETGLVGSRRWDAMEIFDRVGGGDSFASGLIHGLLEGAPLDRAVQLGAAHGALAMTTPGDTSMATATEVDKLAKGASARVQR
ncbi:MULTISPECIES: sugar kinase [unclassified Nocardioides]|uniref:sugar kinase n=1 Tax=unclassified Nocardioides TaxID=2615069 RepID=UPI0009F0BC65|nr:MULTISPECIES: sugar kinase [unclassified Nocardioides]GAW52113.1 PfkB domain-containing protein [Nocardioides sp. PD653-B2]GAW57100.1 PfkB domain-containing protein [Nocardioides sp. PD653]